MAAEQVEKGGKTWRSVRMNTSTDPNPKIGKGSRPSVTEDEVRAARAKLISEKQTLSHRNVRAIIGRGSFSTIGRLMMEIRAKDTHTAQAPEIKELFEELWGLAFAKAKAEAAKDIDELRTNLQEALSEISRMELVEEESTAKVAAANASKDQALSELSRAQDGAHAARVQAMEAASETAKAIQESTSLRVELSVLKATKDETLKQAADRISSLQHASDAKIARLTTDLDSSRAELSRCGSENAGLRERLDILTRHREADQTLHREEIATLRRENAGVAAKMDELRESTEKRVQDAQARVEAALRGQATLAEVHRKELAGMLEKARVEAPLKATP